MQKPSQTGRPGKRFAPQTRCGTSTCLQVEGTGTEVILTNSTPGIEGSVTLTPAEWATFVTNARNGVWDDTVA